MKKPVDIDDYIADFPPEVQKILETLRGTISKAAPDAKEVISYSLPAFKQNGILVYFGVSKKHIGFYPTPSGIEAFKNELGQYPYAKGSVQFPLDKPLPIELIDKIVRFRVQEDRKKSKK